MKMFKLTDNKKKIPAALGSVFDYDYWATSRYNNNNNTIPNSVQDEHNKYIIYSIIIFYTTHNTWFDTIKPTWAGGGSKKLG